MKLLIFFITLILIISCNQNDDSDSDPTPTPPPTTPVSYDFPMKITFDGFGVMGFFDPSIEKDPATNKLWMAYSTIEPMAITPNEYSVYSRLAYSTDKGVTWTDHGILSNYQEHTLGTIPLVYGDDIVNGTAGSWMSETTELHYDPWAPVGERWKAIWMHYLRIDRNGSLDVSAESMFAGFGWLGLKVASTPEGLITAPTQKFMSNFGYETEANTSGAPDYSPVTGAPLIDPTTDFASSDLDYCIMSEPTFHATSTALYLMMGCSAVLPTPIQVYQIMFKCERPCSYTNPSSWSYIGRVITPTDAANIDSSYAYYNGSDIFEYQNETYLVSTPTLPGYRGCEVFKFSDLDTGSLVSEGGKFKVYNRVAGNEFHNGACSFHEAAKEMGFFHSQIRDSTYPFMFQIHQTGVMPTP